MIARHGRCAAAFLALWVAAVALPGLLHGSAAHGEERRGHPSSEQLAPAAALTARWNWPLSAPFRLARPYVAPAHDYGPGHRGIDIEARGASSVHAPAAGTVAFAGQVAGRGVVTIDHGDGLVSTLEPVAPGVTPGDPVAAAQPIGELSAGGHAAGGTLHLGARLDGAYINPLLLLGGVPFAILLPLGG